MARRGAAVRTPRERFARTEPFEIFTRPQRSLLARVLGLVIRLRAEITATVVILAAWVWLTDRLPAWGAGLALGVPALALMAWPASRRYVVRRGWAVLTRHRLRAVFVERRIMNYSGNVPLLLWSRPSAIGDRVWMLLRAGIDVVDIEQNTTHIASTCWASDARVTPHRKYCALVVVDVVRRDPLTGPAVASPHGAPPAPRRRLRLVGGGRSA